MGYVGVGMRHAVWRCSVPDVAAMAASQFMYHSAGSFNTCAYRKCDVSKINIEQYKSKAGF